MSLIRELQDICNNSPPEEDVDESGPSVLQFVSILGNDWVPDALHSSTYICPEHTQELWRIYQINVAPLIAIIHRPSVEEMVYQVSDSLNPDPAHVVLLLSVCYAAIVRMDQDQCIEILGEDSETCIQKYKLAMDQALVRANFIKSQNIHVLQAAVLFLLCLRRKGDTRLVWAASAVVVRVAQGQGLHRDGQHLGLSPFDTEIRRRLWWHICILDMLCSGDQGTDFQIQPGMFDTQLPSNIECDVLTPSLTELPREKVGCTDITLCIVQCERFANLYWPNKFIEAKLSRGDQEKLVKSLATRLENQYLKHLDLDIPVQWMHATIARLSLSKTWLLVHYKTADGSAISQEPADEAFNIAIEVVKFAHLLHTNESTSQWAWLCKSYNGTQRHSFSQNSALAR